MSKLKIRYMILGKTKKIDCYVTVDAPPSLVDGMGIEIDNSLVILIGTNLTYYADEDLYYLTYRNEYAEQTDEQLEHSRKQFVGTKWEISE